MKTVDYYFHIALVPPNGSLKVVLEVTFSFHGHDFFFQNNFPLSHALKNPISSFFPNQTSQMGPISFHMLSYCPGHVQKNMDKNCRIWKKWKGMEKYGKI